MTTLSVSGRAACPVFALAPRESVLASSDIALPGPDDTLHYDGANETGIGMGGGGWFKAGVRFTAPYRCIVKAVLFYQFDLALDGYIFLYGPRSDTLPGALWDSIPFFPVGPESWVRTDLPEERTIQAGADFWVAPEFACPPERYPMGVDAGPETPLRNYIYWTSSVGWVPLSRVGIFRNWNVRAIVEQAGARDVKPDALIEPAAQTWPAPVSPRVRVRNVGAHPALDIPVTLHVDSSGVRLYSETMPIPGLVGPGDYAVAQFPAWHPGPVGAQYSFTAITSLGEDENRRNDTLRTTVSVAGAAFADTLRVRRIGANPPKIDGVVEQTEWRLADAYDVSDLAGRGIVPRPAGSAVARLLYDDEFLYLACQFPNVPERLEGDHFALCMDEDNSGTWSRAESSEGRHTALFAGTDSLVFEAMLTNLPYMWRMPGQCPDALGASSVAGGHLQFEAKIPFGPRRGDLTVSPGDTVGVFLCSVAENGSSYYGWWPQHITSGNWADPAQYGKMIFEPEVGQEEPGAPRPVADALACLPNPSSGLVTLRFSSPHAGPGIVTVFDVSGRSVFSTRSPDYLVTWSLPLDLRRVPAGVYFLRLDADRAYEQKLVIRHN